MVPLAIRLLCLAQCTYLITAQCNPSYLSTISQSTMPRPTESTFISTHYGGYGGGTDLLYDQGRINSMINWGLDRRYYGMNETLFITEWDSDQKSVTGPKFGEMGDVGAYSYNNVDSCTPFTLPCNEYIVAYRIYDSNSWVHGVSFYTSSGCKYDCVGSYQHTDNTVSDHGVVSYYYSDTDFWYLTGFTAYAGVILDGIEFQFTQFTSADSCAPNQSPTALPTENTLFPSTEQSVSPSKSPTSDPTEAPSKAPSDYQSVSPSAEPSASPTKPPTSVPTEAPSKKPSNHPSKSPIFYPTQPPSGSPSNYPSKAPSNRATIFPSFSSTLDPTESPMETLDPSTAPTLPPVQSQTITNYTIYVEFSDDCETKTEHNKCAIDETEIENIILIAVADGNILRTDVVDNKITIVLSVATDEDTVLDKDELVREIKVDLKEKYGEVEVEIDENDDNDSENENNSQFNLSYLLDLSPYIWMAAGALFIIFICCLAARCYYAKKKKIMRQEIEAGDDDDERRETKTGVAETGETVTGDAPNSNVCAVCGGEAAEGRQINELFYCEMCTRQAVQNVMISHNTTRQAVITSDDNVDRMERVCIDCGVGNGEMTEYDGCFYCDECYANYEDCSNAENEDIYDIVDKDTNTAGGTNTAGEY